MAVGGVVMEGRDIGSDVFPDAPVKVYLDASPDVRARRRVLDQAHQAGRSMTGAEVGDALLKRDSIDRTRAVAPLQVPDGAVLLDTSTLERQEVLEAVKAVVRGKLPDLV
jgi:cytidylate kinase